MKTIVINLFSARGSDKSTAAAYLFYNLEMVGVNYKKRVV